MGDPCSKRLTHGRRLVNITTTRIWVKSGPDPSGMNCFLPPRALPEGDPSALCSHCCVCGLASSRALRAPGEGRGRAYGLKGRHPDPYLPGEPVPGPQG